MAVATTGSTTTIGKQLTGTVTAFDVTVVPAGMMMLPEAANTRVEPAKVLALPKRAPAGDHRSLLVTPRRLVVRRRSSA